MRPAGMGITHGPDLCPASCEWGAANWDGLFLGTYGEMLRDKGNGQCQRLSVPE
jgi:hypothetical protein